MSVLRQLGWSFLGSLGSGVLAFATQFVASYALTPTAYGQYSLIVVALTISTLASLWTATGAVRFGTLEHERDQTLDRTFSARQWVTWPSVMLAIVLLAIAPSWLCDFFRLPPSTLRLVIFPLVALTINEHISMMAMAVMRFRLHAIASIVGRLPPLVVVVYALVMGEPVDLSVLVIAMGLGLLSGALAMVAGLGLRTQRIHAPDRARMRELFSYSTPILVTSAANMVVYSGGPVLLRFAIDLEAVGTYQLANLLSNVFALVAISLNRVLLPQFTRLDGTPDGKARLRRLLHTAGPAFGLYGALGLAAFATLGGAIFGAVVSVEHAASALIVPAVICTAAYRLASCVPGSYANATGLTRPMSIVNVTAATVNLLVTWALIRSIGVAAPAIAMTVSEWLMVQLALLAMGVPARSMARAAVLVAIPSLYPLAVAGGWLQPSLPVSCLWAIGCLASVPFATRLLGFSRPEADAALELVKVPASIRRRLV